MHRDCEVEIDVRLRRQRWQGSPSRSCSGIRSYTYYAAPSAIPYSGLQRAQSSGAHPGRAFWNEAHAVTILR